MKSDLYNVSPLIVILGVTSSGKSSLAMKMAKKYNGEIICADSRTVYKGMDIGTAKPSKTDQAEVKHHLLDVISPDEKFTAAEFKRQALKAIGDISSRGKIPIIVGGTGLYIDSLIFDFAFLPPSSIEDREHLQSMSVGELQKKIEKLGLSLPKNKDNPRHLIRVIETNGAIPVKKDIRENTLVIGLDIEKEVIIERVSTRLAKMVDSGLEEEVRTLLSRYGWESPGLSAVGYREWVSYFEGGISSSDVVLEIQKNTINYAKRQRTWFKRNKYIQWVKNDSDAEKLVQYFLQQT